MAKTGNIELIHSTIPDKVTILGTIYLKIPKTYPYVDCRQMSEPEPIKESATIVVLGRFNPAIINPTWLRQVELIRRSDEEVALDSLAITSDFSMFTTDWCRLQATQNRLAIEATSQSGYEPIRDLMVGIFRILEHTPVVSFGLNCDQQFILSDHQEQGCWKKFSPSDAWKDVISQPSMRTLSIQGTREDSESAFIRIAMEAFTDQNERSGVEVRVNQHYSEVSEEPVRNPSFCVERLMADWDDFLLFAKTAIRKSLESAGS